MKESNRYYVRRTIIVGSAVFVVSLLAGIAFRGWHEYHTPIIEPFSLSELLIVSTLGPLVGALIPAPLTIIVLSIFVVLISFGARSRRIWLSLAAFVLLGCYWVFMVEFIRQFALID
jgi:hypothetical protein